MNLYAEDCVKVDNELYLIARSVNIIYKINLDTGNIELVDSLHDVPARGIRAGSCIINHEGTLYFLPMNSRFLNIYKIKEKDWSSIEIKPVDNCYWDRFFSGVLYKDKVHMIGSIYPAIVTYDLKKLKMSTIASELYNSMKNKKVEFDDCYIRRDFAIIEEKLYAVSCVSNQLLIYDLNNQNAMLHSIGEEGLRFSGIAFDGRAFWITARDKVEFYRWEAHTGEFKTYRIKEMQEKTCYLGGAVYDGENVIFTGMNGFDSYFINPLSDDILLSLQVIEESFVFVNNYDEIDYCMRLDGVIELRNIRDFGTVIRTLDVNVDDSVALDYISKVDEIMEETEIVTLPGFLNTVEKGRDYNEAR